MRAALRFPRGGGGGEEGRADRVARSSDSFLPHGHDAGFFCRSRSTEDRVPWESQHDEAAVKSRRHDTRRGRPSVDRDVDRSRHGDRNRPDRSLTILSQRKKQSTKVNEGWC